MPEDQDSIAKPEEAQPATASFASVPDHELVRLIGKGSYGEVWLARNSLGSWRAVKIVYESTFRHRRPFEREFNGVKKFEPVSRLHDGLMDVLQVGHNEAEGYFYCVMELADDVCSGQAVNPDNYTPRTLAQDLTKEKRLPMQECRRIGLAIASALDFLHGRGLIHRDVKPSNIVFVNGEPKLADVGLVAEVSEARSYVGTEGFIPPEGPGTAQSDIYSLGKVLYEISTGKDRHDYPELPTQLGDPVPERELIEFNRVVLKACRADPRERYKAAGAMVDDLRALERGEHLSVRNRHRQLQMRWAKRAGLIASVGLIVGLVILATHQRQNRNSTRQLASGASENSGPRIQGLVAWWQGEGNGDDSVNNNPAVLMNGVGFSPGMVGQGFDFNGTDGEVSVINNTALNFGPNADFSIEAWIKALPATNDSDPKPIVSKFYVSDRDGTQAGYRLYLQDGNLAFQFGDAPLRENGSVSFVSQVPNLVDGRFHHVAVALDRRAETGGKLYVDGRVVLEFDPAIRPGDLSIIEPVRIGASRAFKSGYFFKGIIDDPAIYDRALSTAEIEAIYSAGSNGKRKLPPAILAHPSSRTALVGANVVFNVTASGSPVLDYQWFHDGTNPMATVGSSLALTSVQFSDAGLYSVRITNAFGSVTSSNVVLRVIPPISAPIKPPKGLIAWWKAEGNGNDSAGTNHALLLNGVGFEPGKVGTGFRLNGADGRVIVPDSPLLNFGSNQDFSIEAWIKPLPSVTTYGIMSIVDKRVQTNLSCTLGYELALVNGRLHFRLSDSIKADLARYPFAGPDLRDGKFHHVASSVARQSSAGGKLYVDGQEVLTFDPTPYRGDLSNSEPLRIGSHANPEFNSFFKGVIDEVSIYNRALTAEEIEAVCNAGSAGKSFTY